MPKSVHDCANKLIAEGKPENEAWAICQKNASVEIEEKDDHFYIKAFLLDSSVNLNSWGVARETLDNNISTFIGRPIVITENFQHPESNDPNYDHHLNYQDQFRIGTIIDITNKDGVYSAIAEITNADAKDALRSGNLPLYVSPQIFHDGAGREPDDDARTWRGTHLAIVKKPAYGVKKARVSGQCNGSPDTCVAQLRKASCNFCIKRTIENYKQAKKETIAFIPHGDPNEIKKILNIVTNNDNKVSSLRNKKRILSSKLEDNEKVENNISVEEHNNVLEQLKQANEKIKSLESLTNEKDTVISQLKQGNEDLTNRVGSIEKEIRTKEIANVLSAVTFKTDEERTKRLETLVNSNLSIDSIKETYEPLISATKSGSTKLPQKSASVDNESQVPSWVRLARFYGGIQ